MSGTTGNNVVESQPTDPVPTLNLFTRKKRPNRYCSPIFCAPVFVILATTAMITSTYGCLLVSCPCQTWWIFPTSNSYRSAQWSAVHRTTWIYPLQIQVSFSVQPIHHRTA